MLAELERVTRTGANKFNAHCAELRQLSRLVNRAELPESTQDVLRSEILDILDSRILTYPPILKLLGVKPEMSYKERVDALGISCDLEYSSAEVAFMKLMQDKACDARKSQWRWRIAEEADQKRKLGWYPFFVTLTVNPAWIDPETLWKEGRELRKYIRKLVKVVCRELGHPPAHKQKWSRKEVTGPATFRGRRPKKRQLEWDYRPESDYVTYAGVIEHGKSREHHHAHFMIWMKEIPDHWKQCPNRCIVNPEQRVFNECRPMNRFWKWSLPGLSKSNYYRSKDDVWQKLEFAVPFDKEKGQPMKIAPTIIAGAYITKYMQKDFKEWKHRVKCTRNLGKIRLRNLITKLPISIMEALTWRPNNSRLLHSVSLIHSAPLGLVRSIAKQEIFYHRFKQNRLDSKMLMMSNSGSFTRMLRSVRDGVRPERMHSREFFDWLCQLLGAQRGYSETKLIEAHEFLRNEFPRIVKMVNPISQGGNQIGRTLSV